MSELANIKERNEKIYLVADEDMHKVLGPLKADIKYLLKLVEDANIQEPLSEERIFEICQVQDGNPLKGIVVALTRTIEQEHGII